MSGIVYSPGTLTQPTEQTAETPKAETKQEPAAEQKTEAPKQPSLAEQIRAEREAKAAKAKTDAEETSAAKELAAIKEKLAKHEKGRDNVLLDSLGYLKEALGLDDAEAANVAENIIFSLRPDKAPTEWRQKALEAQYARDKKLAAEREANKGAEEKAAREKAAREAGEALEAEFIDGLAQAIPGFTEAQYPNSVTWFGTDHQEYLESMLHTAHNLAAEATKAGKQADLSVTNIAAVLEKKLAERAGKFKVAPAEEKKAVVKAPVPKLEDKKPIEEKTNKRVGLSEAERIARAAAVVFKD